MGPCRGSPGRHRRGRVRHVLLHREPSRRCHHGTGHQAHAPGRARRGGRPACDRVAGADAVLRPRHRQRRARGGRAHVAGAASATRGGRHSRGHGRARVPTGSTCHRGPSSRSHQGPGFPPVAPSLLPNAPVHDVPGVSGGVYVLCEEHDVGTYLPNAFGRLRAGRARGRLGEASREDDPGQGRHLHGRPQACAPHLRGDQEARAELPVELRHARRRARRGGVAVDATRGVRKTEPRGGVRLANHPPEHTQEGEARAGAAGDPAGEEAGHAGSILHDAGQPRGDVGHVSGEPRVRPGCSASPGLVRVPLHLSRDG